MDIVGKGDDLMSSRTRKGLRLSKAWIAVSLVVFLGGTLPAQAQEPTPPQTFMPYISQPNATEVTGEQVEIAEVAAVQSGGNMAVMPQPAGLVTVAESESPPSLSAQQLAQQEAALATTHLPGPRLRSSGAAPVSGPAPNSESFIVEQASAVSFEEQANEVNLVPSAAPDAQLLRNVAPVTSSGSKSNILEASVAEGGRYAFYTGNWFAARSTNGGTSWTFVNPYADMSDFCCDQVTIYDEARNNFIWYRQGVRDANGANRIRFGTSATAGTAWCNYDLRPTDLDASWTNQWFDYPHLQLGADFLYITTNIFNNANPAVWQRSLILRIPLDSIADCLGYSYWYYWHTGWFTFVPVQGAEHIMYFASNWPTTTPQNSRINIWNWPESVDGLPNAPVTKSVTAWTFTNRGDALCGATAGNWAARFDQRLLTGARYMIHSNNLAIRGRKVLAWWWNVQEGGGFAQPYTEAAAFFEDSLAQVGGNQGRPLMWNSTTCFLYPSVAANKRGDLGLVINYSTGTAKNPSVAFAIADDYVAAPPGFIISGVRTSNRRPSDNAWGDYNTVRPFYPTADTWIGGAHYLNAAANCANCGIPIFFVFGRGRDFRSWNYWQNK
jgi:hypothetical protein